MEKPNDVNEEDGKSKISKKIKVILIRIFLTVGNTLTSLRFGGSDAVVASEDDSDSEPVVLGELDDEDNENITPELLHLAFNKPRSDVFDIDRRANTLLETTNLLKNDTNDFIGISRISQKNLVISKCYIKSLIAFFI